jgi:hypothetical protein
VTGGWENVALQLSAVHFWNWASVAVSCVCFLLSTWRHVGLKLTGQSQTSSPPSTDHHSYPYFLITDMLTQFSFVSPFDRQQIYHRPRRVAILHDPGRHKLLFAVP